MSASDRTRGLLTAIVLVGTVTSAACESRSSAGALPARSPASAGHARPSSPATEPGGIGAEWPQAPGNVQSTRYSTLNQITVSNVGNLKLAWSFSTGTLRGHEAAPVIVNNTMYIVTPYPNYLYALDLTKGGALKWMYKPRPAAAAQGVACCDVVNRGVAYVDGKIIMNTLDAHTIALNADTGEELWRVQLGDINNGETVTMAPFVAKNLVFVGNSGGELGVRGWITALHVDTGNIAWRAYNTGPDRDVLIGPEFKPFYKQDQGKDLGVSTWPSDAWRTGGGTVWGWVSYDPETNLIFHGTGNPGPWNPDLRPGDNKWTTGIFARDADTGQARWYYQFSPHDLYDHDGINENVLVDLTIDGKPRKVILRPERNGYVYVMDRGTGEVLSATGFVPNTSSKGVDPRSGRLIPIKEKETGTGRVVRNICPAAPGAKDWNPSSWSPRTGLLYMGHNNLCMDMEGVEANYIAGTPYIGANVHMYAGPGGNRGFLSAWDPIAKHARFQIPERFPVWSGTVVTAGDLVFYGTMEGWFKALDARSGALLWEFKTGSGIIGQPVTYLGPNGKQYVAILSGVGGWSGAIVSGGLDPRDGSAALGFVNAMKDLPQYTSQGGTLYVFALP
jgi:PQQ-dependent dehydrogenase (methanol/ethanol family)